MPSPFEIAAQALFGPQLKALQKLKQGASNVKRDVGGVAQVVAETPGETLDFLFSDVGSTPLPRVLQPLLTPDDIDFRSRSEREAALPPLREPGTPQAEPPVENPSTLSADVGQADVGVAAPPAAGVQPANADPDISDLLKTELAAFAPRTGVVDTASLTGNSQFAGGAGGQLTFADGETIQVSPELTSGLTITNPFVDDSLTASQQREAALKEEQIQRVSAQAKKKRNRDMLRSKMTRARRVLNDPLVPQAAKDQIINQIQVEMVEAESPDPLDLYDIYQAEESPEVKLTTLRESMRSAISSLYGDDRLADEVSSLLQLDPEGRPDSRFAEPLMQLAETRRRAEVDHRRGLEKEQFIAQQERSKSVDSIREFTEEVFGADGNDTPEARSAIIARVAAHQRKFGPLPGPQPDKLDLQGIYDWLYNINTGGRNPQQVQPQVVPKGVGGTGKVQIIDTISNATEADIERAIEEVNRLKSQGQANVGIRLVFPDGRSGTVQ